MADLRGVAAELSAALPEPVVVLGSPPHDARDLDLLVRPAAAAALADWLPTAGFRPHGDGWLRVAGGTTAVVDLAPAEQLGLPPDRLAALHEHGRPVVGAEHLLLPAPEHVLLLLARRLLGSGGRLDVRRLARARQALVDDPDALSSARDEAPTWGCAGGLALLAAELEGGPVARAERRQALVADGVPVAAPWRDAVRPLVPRRRRRGVVVAVSGLDGSGKSTLTAGLLEALEALDVDAAVLWHRLSYGRLLVLLAAPAKAAGRLLRRRGAGEPVAAVAGAASGRAESHGPAWGGRAWPLVVTLVHVLTAGPATRWHLRRGRVVLRDRYVLDAAVHLADRYGDAAPRSVHLPLLRRGLPRPARAWFLDVRAEEARRRKPEQFSVAELAAQRALYLEHAPLLQVAVLDGTRRPEDLRDEAVRDLLVVLRGAGLLRA